MAKKIQNGKTQTWPGLLFLLHLQASAQDVCILYIVIDSLSLNVVKIVNNYYKLGYDVFIYIFS